MNVNLLKNLLAKIQVAHGESVKAVAYSEGYLDCIKDMLNDDINDFNKIVAVKYDGKVRCEVYDEIISALNLVMASDSVTEKILTTQKQESAENSHAMHPSDKAKSFLERIGRA